MTKTKSRGGNPRFTRLSQHFPNAVISYNRKIVEKIRPLLKRGLSISKCAETLNTKNIPSWRGKNWTYANLARVIKLG